MAAGVCFQVMVAEQAVLSVAVIRFDKLLLCAYSKGSDIDL